ncbi:GNAT family N-acetyltransferase [Kroppenstedtia pulmonis]|uniref:GNAT family N-acetyltransferase n=1 Tax=Kroppenstedtia pulmonis TaxID=1380685 RepID=A0A7D3Y2M1_9BACL|nr:GNAT family N-acetyltransferase [Kroppenstedtia pulmonis]QKG85043.1 GNAT family N-acetyltransferase [Kroppenstedtia pulmonis]
MLHEYVIEGENLVLRPLRYFDLERLRSWRNQDHIRSFFVHREPISSEQQVRWFQNYLKRMDDMMFIIVEKKRYQPIGAAALYHIQQVRAEFGRFMIGEPAARGKGYGMESLLSICRFAFNQLGLRFIRLEVLEENKRAIAIYQRCGFMPAGVTNNQGRTLLQMELSQENCRQM